jgi:hypothetical protein
MELTDVVSITETNIIYEKKISRHIRLHNQETLFLAYF